MNEFLALMMLNTMAAPPVIEIPAPAPQVIHWPGGFLVLPGLAGPEVVLRQPGNGTGGTTVIRNSGNGFGNRIVVSNGGVGGTTVIQNSRNGVGNRIVIDDEELWDLPRLVPQLRPQLPVPVEKLPPAAPPELIPQAVPQPMPEVNELKPLDLPAVQKYSGKDASFWTVKRWSDDYDCNLYWCPKAKTWFRFHKEANEYRAVGIAPSPPTER